ncbi:recombinase family protein [Bacillus cereus group sp. BcHK20]|uniref:recombinase family protein n=1 Tax=Bacillus cereus group sp. BcHK20 TaxID=3018091 RepID=UPI0022E89581|nr:recombinase family protein [Bacillus cereus group sp. BcHK20]MDA1904152.1 recombinase family protein [Bacillus cereus group sp. BcHK20]
MIYGYARISSSDQQISSQISQLKKYGCEKIVQEVITGVAEEKELNRLIASLKEADTIVATRMDRMGRNTKQLLEMVEELEKRNIHLVILDLNIDTRSPTGKFFLTVMSAFSELERTNLKEKQRRGIDVAKAQGKHLGRPRNWSKTGMEEAVKMYQNHRIISEIEDITGVSKASLYRELKRRGITRN